MANILFLTSLGFYMVHTTANPNNHFTIPHKCPPMLDRHETRGLMTMLAIKNNNLLLTKLGKHTYLVTISFIQKADEYVQALFVVEFEELRYSARLLNKYLKYSNLMKDLPLPWGSAAPTWGKFFSHAIAMPTENMTGTGDLVLFGGFSDNANNFLGGRGIVFNDNHILNEASHYSMLQLTNSYDVLKTNAANEGSIFDRHWIRREKMRMGLERKISFVRGQTGVPAISKPETFKAIPIDSKKILILSGENASSGRNPFTFYLDIETNELSNGPSLPLLGDSANIALKLDNGNVLFCNALDSTPTIYILDFQNGLAVDPQWTVLTTVKEEYYGLLDAKFVYTRNKFVKNMVQINDRKLALLIGGMKQDYTGAKTTTYSGQMFVAYYDLIAKTWYKEFEIVQQIEDFDTVYMFLDIAVSSI